MFKIKIISPVHIGTGDSKILINGLDYILHKKKIYFLDIKKLLKFFDATELANAMETGQGIKSMLRNRQIKYEDISSKIVNSNGFSGPKIKSQIRNGFGHPYIPGSSLKGALRSVLVGTTLEKIKSLEDRNENNKEVKEELDKDNKYSPNVESKLLGINLENDPLRLIQVPDITFISTGIISTKIFNLFKNGNEIHGGWKHSLSGKGSTDHIFNDRLLTTLYEYLSTEQEAFFKLPIIKNQKTIDHLTSSTVKPIIDLISSNCFEIDLIQTIKKHSQRYLDREYNFFSKFPTNETDEYILPFYEKLIKLNNSPKSAVLRLGAGSGFHSMTGDWKYNYIDPDTGKDGSHYVAFDDIQRFEKERKNSHSDFPKTIPITPKSRKLCFYKEHRVFKFLPMGYVLLSQEESNPQKLKSMISFPSNQKTETKIENKDTASATPSESKKVVAEMIRKSELGKKPKLVDAIVIGQKAKMMLIQIQVEEFKNETYEIRFPMGMEKGTIIQVEGKLIAKGKKIEISGAPKKKA